MNSIEICSLSLVISVSYTCTLTNWRQIVPPPPEKFGASQILLGMPAGFGLCPSEE